MIYKAFVMYGIKVYMFGDPNQFEPVESGSKIHYDYLHSKTIKQMCPKTKTLQYIEETGRYDKKTHEILYTFLKHGKVSYHFPLINQKCYKNICYLNDTRIKVNTMCCNNFIEGKKYELVKFKYNGKIEEYKVCIGTPILATTNNKEKNIYNTMEFTIEDILSDEGKKIFIVNDQEYDYLEFTTSFIPCFCVTVYKYQGADINEDYNIYDVNRMDKKTIIYSTKQNKKVRIYSFE